MLLHSVHKGWVHLIRAMDRSVTKRVLVVQGVKGPYQLDDS